MEEVIAKSKMYRALKAKQKEEDEEELGQLDETFHQMMRGRDAAAAAAADADGEAGGGEAGGGLGLAALLRPKGWNK